MATSAQYTPQLSYLTEKSINEFINSALREDVAEGDHSSLAAIPKEAKKTARLLVKSEGIIAGIELAIRIFKQVDASLTIEKFKEDGDSVSYGDVAFIVSGSAQSILTAERLVLNCMQRMSAIATKTHKMMAQIKHTKAILLDTRKTTPNFRLCEKWAVVIGGGKNHRFGLFDMIMLKDNHIDFAGGVEEAIAATQLYLQEKQLDLKIEVETRNLQEVAQVIKKGGVQRIMLDNYSLPALKEAVALINGQFEIEASGGINEHTLVPIAETGVDFISVGALTHSAGSMDMSLKAI